MSDGGAVTGVVHAPAEQVRAALLDVSSYPRWQSFVRECTVLEQDDDGRASLVETVLDAKVRTVRYVARYQYDLPDALSWRRVSGDLKDLSASYRLTSRTDGDTDVAVTIGFDAGFYVPGIVKNQIRDQSLRSWLRELRRHVEG